MSPRDESSRPLIGLDDISGGMNLLVKNDENSFSSGVGRERHSDGVKKISVSVVADRGMRPLRSDADHRLGDRHAQMQKVDSLFKGKSAVREDHAVDRRIVGGLVDRAGNFHPLIETNRSTSDPGHLVDVKLRPFPGLWNIF